MAKRGAQNLFVWKRAKRLLTRAGLWKKAYGEYLEIYHSMEGDKGNRRRKARNIILDRYPEADKAESVRIFKQQQRARKKGGETKRLVAIRRRLPQNRVEQIKAVAAERARLHEDLRDERQRRSAADKMIKQAQKKAELAEREVRLKMKDLDREEQIANDVAEALSSAAKIKVEEQGPPDIRRDMQWVYDNLADLICVKEVTGVEYLNEEVLRTAPSNGAIAIAKYALNDQKAFVKECIQKLMSKDDGKDKTDEELAEEAKEELDPDFDGLEQYIEEISGQETQDSGEEET